MLIVGAVGANAAWITEACLIALYPLGFLGLRHSRKKGADQGFIRRGKRAMVALTLLIVLGALQLAFHQYA
jgi:hypothetical protein